MVTQLERTIDKLFTEQAEELSIGEFSSFYIPDYHVLNSKVIKEFNAGRKCVFSMVDTSLIPTCFQIAFKDANNNTACYVIYVGMFYATIGIFANITEWHRKVMKEYGQLYNGSWCLNAGRSERKVPLFTRIFREQQQIGKPYFMPEDGQIFLAQQIYAESIETDKDFYNVVGGVLTIAQKVMEEVLEGKVGEYSFVKDILGALSIYLRLS